MSIVRELFEDAIALQKDGLSPSRPLRNGGVAAHNAIQTATQGPPPLFPRLRATAAPEGRLAADRTAAPSRYLAAYPLRKRHDSRVSMLFLRRAGGTGAERGPDD